MIPRRSRGTISLAVLLLLSQPARASDLVFSGTVIRAGRESISVRLADGRIVDSRLPSTPLGPPFHKGDRVQIGCKTIPRVWEEDTSRYQFLELTNLRILPRSPQAGLPESRDFRGGLSGDAQAKLDHAREVNLDYAAHMPNFVADETAKRYSSTAGSREWRYTDTIQTEIAFRANQQVVRRQIRRNGEPWKRPFEALPGFKWYGGFGTELRPLFDSECPTTMEYEGHAEVRGKQLLEYRFLSPADACFGPFYVEYQRYNPARSGHVYLDDTSGDVIRLEEEAVEFPAEFEFAGRKETVTWDLVKIGGDSYLLPVNAVFEARYSSGLRWRVEVEYTNHRHFESSANITFE